MSFKNEVAVSSVTELHQSTTVSSKAKSQPFVPFGSEPVEELKQDKIAYGIPWLGLATLFISILTIISSWLILHFIDGHVVFTNKFLKPAVSGVHSITLQLVQFMSISLPSHRNKSTIKTLCLATNIGIFQRS